MKITVKTPFFDRRGLHKKGDVVEIDTAAFNPLTMVEIPETKEAVKAIKEEVDEASKKPAKKTTKRRKE